MEHTRTNVFNAINDERKHQDNKWGTITQRPHTLGEWILIAEAELQEAKHAWAKECSDTRALEELLQTAAVLVAALEQNGVVTTDKVVHERGVQRHYALNHRLPVRVVLPD